MSKRRVVVVIARGPEVRTEVAEKLGGSFAARLLASAIRAARDKRAGRSS